MGQDDDAMDQVQAGHLILWDDIASALVVLLARMLAGYAVHPWRGLHRLSWHHQSSYFPGK